MGNCRTMLSWLVVIYKIKNESRNTGDGLTIFLIPDSSRLYPFLCSRDEVVVRRWEIVERCYRGDIGYLVYSSLDLNSTTRVQLVVIYKIKNESRNTGDGLTIFLIPDSSRLGMRWL
jgi:hypothetical protein